MGDTDGAAEQPPQQQAPDVQGENADHDGVVKGTGGDLPHDPVQAESGVVGGAHPDDTFPEIAPASPLPWSTGSAGTPGFPEVVIGGDGSAVASIESNHPYPDRRDVDYIVTACNLYPALLAALATSRQRAEAAEAQLEDAKELLNKVAVEMGQLQARLERAEMGGRGGWF